MHVRDIWRAFRRRPMAMVGLFMLLAVVFVAVFAPWLAPYNPYESIDVTAADIKAKFPGDAIYEE